MLDAIRQERATRPTGLEHGLQPHLDALARFNSTRELEASPLYGELRAEVERVLNGVVVEDCRPAHARGEASEEGARPVRVTAWNIERGKQFEGILSALGRDPSMGGSDVLLLTELDYGMARTGNRFVARELAERLGLSFAFAPCYVALNKGSGVESVVGGENTLALHGNALLSRFPLSGAHSLALPNGKDKMRGKEKRLGSQRAVVADVEHPAGAFRAVSLHLDAHSTQRHRLRQMRVVLDHLETLRPRLPVVVGGDWNTSTYNSKRAVYSIVGFFRRVAMGAGRFVRNHYPYPERWFERRLFGELERRGYLYRELNEMGAGTLHYDVADLVTYENLREWVPRWCFSFIRWSLKETGGRCSLKLDWFTGRGIRPAPGTSPKVVGGLSEVYGPLSDHDPIVLDLVLSPPAP